MPLTRVDRNTITTARHYVDELQELLSSDHINKGELDGEDMSQFKEDTIASKLRDKIYDSSITIVLISKNMKSELDSEKDQWIPWEVSYSLREATREDRTSSTNAGLAIVLPDEFESYTYLVEATNCTNCNTVSWKTGQLFEILRENMFNRKEPKQTECQDPGCGQKPHTGSDHSYIFPVKWSDFIEAPNSYIDIAIRNKENIDDFDLVKAMS